MKIRREKNENRGECNYSFQKRNALVKSCMTMSPYMDVQMWQQVYVLKSLIPLLLREWDTLGETGRVQVVPLVHSTLIVLSLNSFPVHPFSILPSIQ